MTKDELIFKRDNLIRMSQNNNDSKILREIRQLNDKIKRFPHIRLLNKSGEVICVFATINDAEAFIYESFCKTYMKALDAYRKVEGNEGFRKNFLKNWEIYSDHSLILEMMDDDVNEEELQTAWEYYGCDYI